jgi:hypothetical protein
VKIRQALRLAIARSGQPWCGGCSCPRLVESPAERPADGLLQGLSDLTAAFEGTSGDEGARIGAALDRMSAALATWDAEIRRPSRHCGALRQCVAVGTPSRGISRWAACMPIAAVWQTRWRNSTRPSAGAHACRCARASRSRALQSTEYPRTAIEAFRRAHALEPGEPVTAYYLFHEAATSGNA